MSNIKKIITKLQKSRDTLARKYGVKSLEVFGSYVKGEQKKRSDLDLLVEFYETVDLFQFIELEQFLSELLGVKVDLIMKDTLKPRIKDRILKEAIPV